MIIKETSGSQSDGPHAALVFAISSNYPSLASMITNNLHHPGRKKHISCSAVSFLIFRLGFFGSFQQYMNYSTTKVLVCQRSLLTTPENCKAQNKLLRKLLLDIIYCKYVNAPCVYTLSACCLTYKR